MLDRESINLLVRREVLYNEGEGEVDLKGRLFATELPPIVINWSVSQLQGSPVFVMADPFRTYVQESRDYWHATVTTPSCTKNSGND